MRKKLYKARLAITLAPTVCKVSGANLIAVICLPRLPALEVGFCARDFSAVEKAEERGKKKL